MALSYGTLTVSVAQNIAKHALSSITIIFIPDKEPKYRTVRLNTGHMATLARAAVKMAAVSGEGRKTEDLYLRR